MEKTGSIQMIPYPSGWSDLGSWKRLEAVLPKDGEGNYLSGQIKAVNTKECLIFGDGITTFGVDNLLIVKVGEEVIICKKEDAHHLGALKPGASLS